MSAIVILNWCTLDPWNGHLKPTSFNVPAVVHPAVMGVGYAMMKGSVFPVLYFQLLEASFGGWFRLWTFPLRRYSVNFLVYFRPRRKAEPWVFLPCCPADLSFLIATTPTEDQLYNVRWSSYSSKHLSLSFHVVTLLLSLLFCLQLAGLLSSPRDTLFIRRVLICNLQRWTRLRFPRRLSCFLKQLWALFASLYFFFRLCRRLHKRTALGCNFFSPRPGICQTGSRFLCSFHDAFGPELYWSVRLSDRKWHRILNGKSML